MKRLKESLAVVGQVIGLLLGDNLTTSTQDVMARYPVLIVS